MKYKSITVIRLTDEDRAVLYKVLGYITNKDMKEVYKVTNSEMEEVISPFLDALTVSFPD